MRRVTYTFKKLIAGFIVLALFTSEVGAARLAPVISPNLLRPPSANPRNPVPVLPAQRVRSFKTYKKLSRPRDSALLSMGRTALRYGADLLSRPAQNMEIYKKVYGPRLSSFFARPARNWEIVKKAVGGRLNAAPIPKERETRMELPAKDAVKKFAGETWEGVGAVIGAFSDLLESDSEPVSFGNVWPKGPAEKPAASSLSFIKKLDSGPVFASGDYSRESEANARIVRLIEEVEAGLKFLSVYRRSKKGPIWVQNNGESLWPRSSARIGTHLPMTHIYQLGRAGAASKTVKFELRVYRLASRVMRRRMIHLTYSDYRSAGREDVIIRATPVSERTIMLEYAGGAKENLEILHAEELSPLVLDLNGDGVKTSDKKVRYDLDGDGRRDLLNDISREDAVLVFDADGDGVSGENGKELFGDLTDLRAYGADRDYRDGFASLGVLAHRAAEEGIISGVSLERGRLDDADLAVLEKRYGLRVKIGSFTAAPVSLSKAGITELRLSRASTMRVENFDGRGNHLSSREGAQFIRKDGTAGSYGDIWFRYLPGSRDFSPAS